MYATNDLLLVWKKFDQFPMETLTKAWFYHKSKSNKQRDITLMKEHRFEYGVSGNCFDLAIWLLDEFKKSNIKAYPIGHDIATPEAHVAVVAINEKGNRYLCDLGDQWITPILVDRNNEDYSEEKLADFFPGAKIQIKAITEKNVQVFYHRPNGKVSCQSYDLEPIEREIFLKAAEKSQNSLKDNPLLECRVPYQDEIAHWEFSHWTSFLSTSRGLFKEPIQQTVEDWVSIIHQKTGINQQLLLEALTIYKKSGTEAGIKKGV